jgi:hypothetical protein
MVNVGHGRGEFLVDLLDMRLFPIKLRNIFRIVYVVAMYSTNYTRFSTINASYIAQTSDKFSMMSAYRRMPNPVRWMFLFDLGSWCDAGVHA